MRLGRRVARFLFWGLVLCLSSLAGGLWFAYWYITDSETISRIIREHAVRYLPNSRLDPGRVRPDIRAGELVLHDLRLRQPIEGSMFETLRIAFLSLQVNPRKLAEWKFEPSKIIIGQPTLRLRAKKDGTWNIQGLLADPWPGPWIETPPIQIRNGTVELYPYEESSSTPERPLSSPAGTPLSPLATGLPAAPSPSTSLPSPRSPGAEIPSAMARTLADHSPAILRDVTLTIKPGAKGQRDLKFDGSASGDGFERLTLAGSIDLQSGVIDLSGELDGLVISESLRRKLPPPMRPSVQALALNGGVVTLEVNRLLYNPAAPPESRLRCNMVAHLREGVWECPQLPLTVNDLSAVVIVDDRVITIKDARGSNGNTNLSASGVIVLDGNNKGSMDLHVELDDLELNDDRLRKKTPPEYAELWDLFKPQGRINVGVHVTRPDARSPVAWTAKVRCRDVAAVYRHFAYPLDHLTGDLIFEKNTLSVDLNSLNGRPLQLKGTIWNPGPDAVVKLDIHAESLPIDDAIKNAMPENVRKVVDGFKASGLVNVSAKVYREPMAGANAPPEGKILFDADIDLTERCEITWDRLPYPVRNLKGRLEIHPDKWTFKNVIGSNGQAVITASGNVEKLELPKEPGGEEPLKIDIALKAEKLPFSAELQAALPEEWAKTWPTINPSGSCDVRARVHVEPRGSNRIRTQISITPRPETSLRLLITRSPQPGIDPGGSFEIPMDDVHGRFDFDNGDVTMSQVNFSFRGSPVKFSSGTVFLRKSGQFKLSVQDAWVEEIRFDLDLRKKMPPLMAQFALRLDGGGPFRARGDLDIGWSGKKGDLAWCRWQNTKVIFNDNAIRTAIPIEHIQGELRNVSGWSNGMTLEVGGIVNLESVSFIGQQITQLESPFHVKEGRATLDSVRAHYLGGEVLGDDPSSISLDATPRYHAALSLKGARLEEYARTISGRQSYRGNIDARIAIDGLGSDVRSIHGRGEAHITQGDLGELPLVLRVASSVFNSVPNISVAADDRNRTPGKTAFDSADVDFTIADGMSTFDPIRFTGNAFSLIGRGTLDPQGYMDLRLNLLWGRDRFHIPLVSDFARQASSRFFIAHVRGTPSNFKSVIVPLPPVGDALRALNRTRADSRPE
jgi:hypothetical protein